MSIEFENILNFRDVGKTINDYTGRKLVREGVLYRSAGPDDATAQDRHRLKDELGIKTVMDLRSKTEHLDHAGKKPGTGSKVPATLQSDAAASEPLRIPGLEYHGIRVAGRSLHWEMARLASWWCLIQTMFLYFLGYRIEAANVMSREVTVPLGLVNLSILTMDASKTEVAEALRLLVSPSTPRPVLIHCEQGKDRTGMIVALVLLALNVPQDAINADYMLSQEGLDPERKERIAGLVKLGLTPEWMDCAPDLISRVSSHLDTRYGGVDGYLNAIGFDVEDKARIVEVFGI